MGYAELKREELPSLLTEVGVDETTSREFCKKFDQDDLHCLLSTTKKVRSDLLEKVHEEERKIDRLDFLIYHLQKKMKKA